LPLVFTENGVAILSGILNSDRAIYVNITIMRTFTKLRRLLVSDKTVKTSIDKFEQSRSANFANRARKNWYQGLGSE